MIKTAFYAGFTFWKTNEIVVFVYFHTDLSCPCTLIAFDPGNLKVSVEIKRYENVINNFKFETEFSDLFKTSSKRLNFRQMKRVARVPMKDILAKQSLFDEFLISTTT